MAMHCYCLRYPYGKHADHRRHGKLDIIANDQGTKCYLFP